MKKFSEHQFLERAGFKTDHHLQPRVRGGKDVKSNLLELDAYRHAAWHLLFKELTLDEVIDLLKRLKGIKKNQRLKFLEEIAASF